MNWRHEVARFGKSKPHHTNSAMRRRNVAEVPLTSLEVFGQQTLSFSTTSLFISLRLSVHWSRRVFAATPSNAAITRRAGDTDELRGTWAIHKKPPPRARVHRRVGPLLREQTLFRSPFTDSVGYGLREYSTEGDSNSLSQLFHRGVRY